GRLGDLDDVTGTEAVRRDVDTLTVDQDVAVGHELAGLAARVRDAEAADYVVEPRVEAQQEHRAGGTLGAFGLYEEVMELPLAHVVVDAQLLLLAQTHTVIARLTTATLPVLARGVRMCLHVALNLWCLHQVGALTAAKLDYRSSVSTHVSPSPCSMAGPEPKSYGRLRLRGRQPLCGVGVSSMIVRTFTPVAWIER